MTTATAAAVAAAIEILPMPGWSELTRPYWEAAAEGRLVVQQCSACNTHRWEPVEVCHHCHSQAWTWAGTSGYGEVYTFTWADARAAGVDLYNLAVVELDDTRGDPIRILSWVVGVGRKSLRCGMPVEVAFAPVAEGIAVPHFRPRREPGASGDH
ncbi:Zn-ribbon domain-containing OB-fold protein [Pseudonocardia sp. GCM10023141]|uniref:Zn-ribbon domain-containing OB-fold protein n=1 Tax=Pseudonocardia sp. GCM10023141 TaxID=3252653 RepID=UPI0036136005